MSEAYIKALKEAAQAQSELWDDNFNMFCWTSQLKEASPEEGILRDLAVIHYGIIHPLIRVNNLILRHRIFTYSEGFQHALLCSASEVFACLRHFLDDEAVIEKLSGLDAQLVTSYREKDESRFAERYARSDESTRNRLSAVCYLCAMLNDECAEVRCAASWDDLKDSTVIRVRNGLREYVTESFQGKLLSEVFSSETIAPFTQILGELNNIHEDRGDAAFYLGLVEVTEKLYEAVMTNYQKHSSKLCPEEENIVSGVFKSKLPLPVEEPGISKSGDINDVLADLRGLTDILGRDKYDADLPYSIIAATPGEPDDKVSFRAVKGIGSVFSEQSLVAFKSIYHFLTKETCSIPDSLENYRLLLWRLTGKNCGCKDSDTIPWLPVQIKGRKSAGMNAARRVFSFISLLVGTGSGKGSGKLLQADRYFSISGQDPSSFLTPSDTSSHAATQVDSDFETAVKNFCSTI